MFGGSGLAFGHVEGPGTVYIQSLPQERLRANLMSAKGQQGGNPCAFCIVFTIVIFFFFFLVSTNFSFCGPTARRGCSAAHVKAFAPQFFQLCLLYSTTLFHYLLSVFCQLCFNTSVHHDDRLCSFSRWKTTKG